MKTMRLVDADELERVFIGKHYGVNAIKYFIKMQPTIDAIPVKHGHWKKAYADHEAFGERPFYRYCSECCEVTVFPYKFCPNCGVKMDGMSE